VKATLNETQVTAGESVGIAIEVENTGEQTGTFTANVTVDSTMVASKSVTVEPGETETEVFDHRFDEPGEYEIAVTDTSLGVLIVTAADGHRTTTQLSDDADGSNPIEVVEATVPADWVRSGHVTTVKATVVNTGNRRTSRTLRATVDDRPVGIETVDLLAHESEVVEIEAEIPVETSGGTVAVGGVEAGRITVGGSPGEVRTVVDDPAGNAGWGIGLGIPVLAAVILLPTGVSVVLRRI